ncbi:MAG: exosortase system-associated protein, TIGR04073 family [Gammaproteobacteria bacterium]|nr:MAG: exosortase system-associated protein, TIGR04073 family [Gammaproteobacteria bacterium]
MKQTIALSLLACIFLSFSSLSNAEQAQETQDAAKVTYGSKVGDKALRSLANISLGFIEIPKNIIIISNRTNLLYGLTGGTGLGVLNTAGRITVGLLDLLTFPLATQPIAQPVYPWDNYLIVDTSYNDMFALDFPPED